MADQEQTSTEDKTLHDPKGQIIDLTNDDVATLHNILFSGFTVSARVAKNVANLQDWVAKLVAERGIPKEK